MSKRPEKTILSVILCMAVIGMSWSGIGSAAANSKSTQQLFSKLGSQPTVKVIVTSAQFNSQPQAKSATKGSVDRLKQAKALIKQRHPNSARLRLKREYTHLPHMVYEVNADGLQDLLSNPAISVHQNRIARPNLAQSVGRVYPSQEFSSYHGNNDWTVAVIDSGVNGSHPMLSGKVVSEACYSTTDTSALDADLHFFSLCPGGASSSTASGSGQDCSLSIEGCGHGTSMAGIAVGNAGNRLGVAKDGNIIAIKVASEDPDPFNDVCDSSSCVAYFETDVLLALDRVLALRSTFNIAAVNLSLNFNVLADNGTCDDDPLKPAIDMLRDAGIVTVISAGNNGAGDKLSSPSCISTSFSVGATLDTSDALWPETNRSRNMDLFAPGANIITARGSGYATVTGTSAAAAHVSGAWVAARHAWPTASISQLENLIRSRGPIVFTATSGQSKRRLDLTAILNSIDPGSQDDPNPPSPTNLAGAYLLLLLEEELSE